MAWNLLYIRRRRDEHCVRSRVIFWVRGFLLAKRTIDVQRFKLLGVSFCTSEPWSFFFHLAIRYGLCECWYGKSVYSLNGWYGSSYGTNSQCLRLFFQHRLPKATSSIKRDRHVPLLNTAIFFCLQFFDNHGLSLVPGYDSKFIPK
jgi:hypothetical protein